MWHSHREQTFVPTNQVSSTWNMASTGKGFQRGCLKMLTANDRWTMNAWLCYKLNYEPKGSDDLKTWMCKCGIMWKNVNVQTQPSPSAPTAYKNTEICSVIWALVTRALLQSWVLGKHPHCWMCLEKSLSWTANDRNKNSAECCVMLCYGLSDKGAFTDLIQLGWIRSVWAALSDNP